MAGRSSRKKPIGMTGLRYSLRAAMGLHRGKLNDMIERLEKGARLGPWIDEMRSELEAGVPCIDILVKEHGRKGARS